MKTLIDYWFLTYLFAGIIMGLMSCTFYQSIKMLDLQESFSLKELKVASLIKENDNIKEKADKEKLANKVCEDAINQCVGERDKLIDAISREILQCQQDKPKKPHKIIANQSDEEWGQ